MIFGDESKSLRIALDYDETFTADKGMWTEVVRVMRRMGHQVTMVTFRKEPGLNQVNDSKDLIADCEELGIPYVFTNHKQKAHHFDADIWIDDAPERIASYKGMQLMMKNCEKLEDYG